ncbi:MAG: flagellar hook-associated protein FlgK [Deltaproteobacteria bacterium]|jgi:flagellar hook-associated protein 1 FlgK|nr:flagellar hook-associated protein FlgK [Deltaproteobacteria bacterium]
MALGVNSILNMGLGALFSSQVNIQTTGNNIANVDTPGYSRQKVLLEDKTSLDYSPGQIGQGVEATQIIRYFDKFVESAYLDRQTMQSRYDQELLFLRNLETIYNEANDTPGLGSALSNFFNSWNTLAQEPDSQAARAALLETVNTLSATVRSLDTSMRRMQEEMEIRIREDVDKANSLIQEIADLNREINIHTITNRNNANQLMDQRDEKVRELSAILDLHVDDRGAGNYTVSTSWGCPLVQQDIPFALEVRGPQAENNLSTGSLYAGTVEFDGLDEYEYTLEVVQSGTVDQTGVIPPAPGTAAYRVSLDGGKSWIVDEATGQPKLFYATDLAHSAQVKDLAVSFSDTAGVLAVGDKFVLTPKNDVYWISPTAGAVDISSQTYANGTENIQRITGGTLGAALDFRDNKIGVYRDRLAELTDSLSWEVNRIHSQGAGLTPLSSVLGSYAVGRTNIPLGSPSAGFHWSERLQSGNMTFAIYDPVTGDPLQLAGVVDGLDVFSPGNFDPALHSLEDVVNAINSGPAGAYLEASIVDSRLQISGKETSPGSGQYWGFGLVADTSGLAAALGINTFFSGESPAGFSLREDLVSNPNLINAGRVNGGAEGNEGDNITAAEIAALAAKTVSIGGARQTIVDFYAATVTKVGADTQHVNFLDITETVMANELKARKDEISSVNLDEEMSNLIKFQASYKAAAKLITTADEMIQTLLSLKP